MREVIQKYNVYKFQELPLESQEKTIEKHNDINTSFDWYEFTINFWVEKLNEIGFIDCEIEFSGFWLQGDGACFDLGKKGYIDINKLAKHLGYKNLKRIEIISNYITGCIFKNSYGYHYSHANTRYFEISNNLTAKGKTKRIENFLNELERDIESLRKNLSEEIYKDLEKEYDYLNSKEAIIETFDANEYEFTLAGNIHN